MAKQRLDYNHLAEVLGEKGLVDPATLQHILQQSVGGGELFPEVLVRENLVADWELSRTTCEAFHLVFLSLDFYEPSSEAVELFDAVVLHQYCLVPLDVYDDLLTIAMPALTPSEVLDELATKLGKTIQPVVGTVTSNRRWLIDNVALEPVLPASEEGDWSTVFDEGDAAVLMDLENQVEGTLDVPLGEEAPAPVADSSADAPEPTNPDGLEQGGLEDLLS